MKYRPDTIITGYLIFKKEFEDYYNVENKKKEMLGYLKYERVGRFKHWCWYQYQDIRMSPGCLEELRHIQKKLASSANNKKESE